MTHKTHSDNNNDDNNNNNNTDISPFSETNNETIEIIKTVVIFRKISSTQQKFYFNLFQWNVSFSKLNFIIRTTSHLPIILDISQLFYNSLIVWNDLGYFQTILVTT